MHPLLRIPYAAAGAAAELAAALSSGDDAGPKWRRSLSARHGLADRLRAFAAQRDPSRPLVWFHAPSVGEALMARPVLEGVRSEIPRAQAAFTWYSPSVAPFASTFPAEFRDYLPFDTSSGASAALDALRPTALVYSKLDVWPVLTEHAVARNVRVALIAASLSQRSSRRGAVARGLLRDAYARLAAVGAASADDAARLVELGVRPDAVSVTGDTRYDQVWARMQAADTGGGHVGRLASDRTTLVAGSTWPADEKALLHAWEAILKHIPGARLIVAPHEPSGAHIASLREWATRAGLSVAGVDEDAAAGADVILVDRVGILADLYALADVAFVGGGFHGFGLHSVLEPAAYGVPVVFGPEWQGSRDASGLVSLGGARPAGAAPELAATVALWFTDDDARSEAGTASVEFVKSGLGAAARSVELVKNLLH